MSNLKPFENAEVQREANVYYDGNVTSREIHVDGQRMTLGIMLPGEYTFPTDEEEEITMYRGSLSITYSDGTTKEFSEGNTFTIPADTEAEIEVDSVVDYCCRYH